VRKKQGISARSPLAEPCGLYHLLPLQRCRSLASLSRLFRSIARHYRRYDEVELNEFL
jgi:hypothetical protein